MSRFTVAIDMEDWQKGQRSRKRRRKAGKAGKAGKRLQHPQRPVRERDPEERGGRRGGAPPHKAHDLVVARPRGPGRDDLRGEDEDQLHEAELDPAELEPEDLGEEAAPRHRKVRDRVHDAVSRDWQKPQDLGSKMRIQTRAGTRAAIIEVKSGLFVVAEVPVESVEFGFGPMLLAPALIKTLGRALQGSRSAGGAGRAHRPELSARPQRQLPGPTEEQDQTEGRLAPWLDADVAEELGCPCEVRRDRRKP